MRSWDGAEEVQTFYLFYFIIFFPKIKSQQDEKEREEKKNAEAKSVKARLSLRIGGGTAKSPLSFVFVL